MLAHERHYAFLRVRRLAICVKQYDPRTAYICRHAEDEVLRRSGRTAGRVDLRDGRGPRRVAVGDWPEMRGPSRDGLAQPGLIDKWALNGENFLWRVPYGGRSAPIVMGNRVYVQNPSGRGVNLQERVMALDADSGKVVWEYKFNLPEDVPAHRSAGLRRRPTLKPGTSMRSVAAPKRLR